MAEGKIVVITGITGYLATELAFQLVEKGYKVRGTVRSIAKAKDIQHLLPTVQLFEADLLQEGSFDKALEGAAVLLHTASPFVTSVPNPQTDLIDPALNGTKNVLASAARHGIKNIVITGSVASVVQQFPKEEDRNKVWNEDDWNTTSSLTDGPYRLSKVLAERASYEWAAQHPDVKLVTILPTFIMGPPRIRRADATSIQFMVDALNGVYKAGIPAGATGVVDVRDVAYAHWKAFEDPNAKGRYMVTSERAIPRGEIVEILKEFFPDPWPLPLKQIGEVQYKGGSLIESARYSNAKALKEFKMTLTPYKRSLLEMALKLIDFGLIKKPENTF
jgi:nucleoside-diphosphate-sugar epimerase